LPSKAPQTKYQKNQKSKIKNQKSKIKNQKSKIKNESKVVQILLFYFLGDLNAGHPI
jgi:hypothetical protein